MSASTALTGADLANAPGMGDMLLQAARSYPNNPVLIFPDSSMSYAQLEQGAYRYASALHARGIRSGDHVGILMPNCPEYIEALFGIALLGGVAVTINARYKATELAYVIHNSDVKALITSDLASEYVDFADLLHEAFPDLATQSNKAALTLKNAPLLKLVTLLGTHTSPGMLTISELTADSSPPSDVDAERSETSGLSPNLMMYTSGTTANPKGCPIGGAALVTNGAAMAEQRYFLTATDRFWSPLPMFHMSSILPLVACMSAGAALLSMNHFDSETALNMLESENVTIAFPAFPTITNELISHPSFADRDLSKLRRINNVAPIELLRKFQAAFPQAVQTGAYGLTEVCGVIAFNHPDEPLETRLTTCGAPFEGIDVRIVDPETLQTLPVGERGEILLRGYAVFDGYYNAPDKNAEAFHDGWFRTGDLASVDDAGRIAFHGRLKDMLKVGGENVAAVEIESFLAGHPAVKLAQVVGVPDDRLLEVPAAYIELQDGATLAEQELIDWSKGKIASFKIPRHVRFVTDWPMSSTKVQKFRLVDQFLAEQAG